VARALQATAGVQPACRREGCNGPAAVLTAGWWGWTAGRQAIPASGAAGQGADAADKGRPSGQRELPCRRRNGHWLSHRHNPSGRAGQPMPGWWLVAVRAPGSGQRPTPALLARTGRPSGSPRVQIDLLGAVLTAPPHAGTCAR